MDLQTHLTLQPFFKKHLSLLTLFPVEHGEEIHVQVALFFRRSSQHFFNGMIFPFSFTPSFFMLTIVYGAILRIDFQQAQNII
ncbi:CLUMA_CG019955, isoform A [Clunio marinus]|uniref:CLUMA_CG019955, isoform A n=1 Tax=Clunio marinus TaxID=568069 RepID=A0A1J1J566_9DIPT|nr:CLUMA_CG019955, isoform A [Clunio marinus]